MHGCSFDPAEQDIIHAALRHTEAQAIARPLASLRVTAGSSREAEEDVCRSRQERADSAANDETDRATGACDTVSAAVGHTDESGQEAGAVCDNRVAHVTVSDTDGQTPMTTHRSAQARLWMAKPRRIQRTSMTWGQGVHHHHHSSSSSNRAASAVCSHGVHRRKVEDEAGEEERPRDAGVSEAAPPCSSTPPSEATTTSSSSSAAARLALSEARRATEKTTMSSRPTHLPRLVKVRRTSLPTPRMEGGSEGGRTHRQTDV